MDAENPFLSCDIGLWYAEKSPKAKSIGKASLVILACDMQNGQGQPSDIGLWYAESHLKLKVSAKASLVILACDMQKVA